MENKISTYNKMGLIPGPQESLEDFLKRSECCLELNENLTQFGELAPQEVSAKLIAEASSDCQRLYDITPTWVPLLFDNYKLSFWHGGCAWIFQLEEDSPLSALLQLRKRLQTSSTYLRLLRRKEVVVHELAHIGRMAFNEPKYEELLAYKSSDSSFRSFFGAIAQSSKETAFFTLILILILMIDCFLLLSGYYHLYFQIFVFKFIPLVLVGFGMARVIFRQRKLASCLKKFKQIALNPEDAMAIVYRLTDQEIELFSAMSLQQIRKYFEENKQSVRLELIAVDYLGIR